MMIRGFSRDVPTLGIDKRRRKATVEADKGMV